ncbi:MAG: hypothetical protein FD174_1737 [Geobacteraceae bacterium]|nr:MAG: hypothetical protein FD174_1737 [Geobacteraceae bacterium]
MTTRKKPTHNPPETGYDSMLSSVVGLLEEARRAYSRAVNTIMTATYWEVGRRIIEFEQRGKRRAEYGASLLKRLSADLTMRFGKGFSERNLEQMRLFYLGWPISQTVSAKSDNQISQTVSAQFEGQIIQMSSGQFSLSETTARFPLYWSHYVRLISVKNPDARAFYEAEDLRCGWNLQQLDRQISTLFYERTALSRNKAAMLQKGDKPRSEDAATAEDEIKDPFVLEFLGLKDEYSESDLEEALILHLEHFLLELGSDFTFVGRQRRLRIGDSWYRVDLVFFHRRLRCLVLIDLKLDKFTHADAGQMHMYLNYAREHWTHESENPPVGLILCAEKDHALARYALEGLPNKVMAAEYKTVLPDEKALVAEIDKTRKLLEERKRLAGGG